MDPSFWNQKWKQNSIAFHKSEANPALVKYFEQLSLAKGDRIFVPLCGKTLDIAWLLSEGYRVAGAELVEMAVEKLFDELGVEPELSTAGKAKRYSAKDVDIFVGNIFDVSKEALGPVNASYDRAALVALPQEIRNRYTAHLTDITNNAPQLLITFEYDQSAMAGPPFSIGREEVEQHYSASYDISLLASADVLNGLKGECPAKESVWLLKPH
ncbi:MAG: thiopurine S-methyltransferase [Elainellaceae cyanobacterium]